MRTRIWIAAMAWGWISMMGPAGADDNLIGELMASKPGWFGEVVESPDQYQVQILYTQIDRDAEGRPSFTRHSFGVDPERYFYPASTVKLAGALLALEKLNRLDIEGLDRDTPLRIETGFEGQTAVETDETAPDGVPTIGHYIHKIFLVSDNDAYNRLYEFVGQKEMNEALAAKGYDGVRLTHRLSISLSPEENRHTNPFTFYNGEKVIYEQPAAVNPDWPGLDTPLLLGDGYMADGELVQQPMDFAGKNAMPIDTLQEMLQAAIFPESVPAKRRFNLTPDDYDFLHRSMGLLPRESEHPRYEPPDYYDSYVKFALFGGRKNPIPQRTRLLNKVGEAYGFLIENAYIVDFKLGIEFMLTAVISVNENRIFNDDEYEYEEIGMPFLANLGRVVYSHELRREKEFLPDLTRLEDLYPKVQKTWPKVDESEAEPEPEAGPGDDAEAAVDEG